MKSKQVEWVGGPDDGQKLVVPEETMEICIVYRMGPPNITDKQPAPTSYVSTGTKICPIRGNKIYYNGLPNTPRST